MKNSFNTILISAILLTLSFATQAQSADEMYENRTFYGGLVLGSNFSQIDGDNFAGYHKIGMNVGGLVYIKLGENVAASMEVLLSQKGSRSKIVYESQPGLYVTKYGADFNYAQVPIMINYFDRRKSHFGAGLSYGQLASANEYVSTSPNMALNTNEFQFKKMDLNFLMGCDIHMWKGLFFNARFEYSLLSIRGDVSKIYAKRSQYNNTWTFRLMYLFM